MNKRYFTEQKAHFAEFLRNRAFVVVVSGVMQGVGGAISIQRYTGKQRSCWQAVELLVTSEEGMQTKANGQKETRMTGRIENKGMSDLKGKAWPGEDTARSATVASSVTGMPAASRSFKQALCFHAHLCEHKGLLNAIEGNLSILDRERGLLYITPSRTRKLDLAEDDVAVLDFETEQQLSGKKASSEYRLHKAALLARPDCNAVLHTHVTYLTAYAILGKPISCNCANLFQFIDGDIACLPYGKAGTPQIAEGIEEALKGRPLCLLGNHGAVSVGETLELAVGWMEAIEATVKTVETAKMMGTPQPIPE